MDMYFLQMKEACTKCLTLNGSIFFIAYALLVFYLGLSYDKKQMLSVNSGRQVIPDLSKFNIPTVSIQTMILQYLSRILTPRVYLLVVRKITQNIKTVTKINKRSFFGNFLWFFLIYYLVVSAPAASMIPVNYNVIYTPESVVALFLMMVTNVVGDIISIKITLKNLQRISSHYRKKLLPVSHDNNASLKEGFKLEIMLYLITIKDMLYALSILIIVLVLTSIYFGVSVGEYSFEFTQNFFNGALDRAKNFIPTVFEPYWFRQNIIALDGHGWPMLLIYGVSTFIPTILLLGIALFWTLTMPLRIIYSSKWQKYQKIVLSEIVVLVMCSCTVIFFNFI